MKFLYILFFLFLLLSCSAARNKETNLDKEGFYLVKVSKVSYIDTLLPKIIKKSIISFNEKYSRNPKYVSISYYTDSNNDNILNIICEDFIFGSKNELITSIEFEGFLIYNQTLILFEKTSFKNIYIEPNNKQKKLKLEIGYSHEFLDDSYKIENSNFILLNRIEANDWIKE
ncbi:MAG: hypothetical protein Q8K02_16780 [Flavobacterium sp.]|nr:hypothetical protein [Flavobacterium sp.]